MEFFGKKANSVAQVVPYAIHCPPMNLTSILPHTAWLLAPAVLCAATNATDPSHAFKRMEVQIAMRDGVKLYTDIYVPKKARAPLPFLMTRTPYGATDEKGANPLLPGSYKDFVQEGYIFVFQDIRGRYKSEGQFVMFRPPRDKNDPKAIDESTDTYDTISWLIEHIPNNNGRVGVLGISYGGWLTVMAMLDPHPALKAVSEQASPADQFLGDDFHHNGAFRLSYGVEYSAMMETGTTNFHFQFDKHDTFEWYAALGALSNFNKNYGHEKLPTWNDFVAHPNYDEFWQKQAVWPYLDTPKVPNLNVAGWWDQEDFYGPMKIYETLEKKDTNHMNYVIAGPWNHGGWSRGPGHKLGEIDFESDTAEYFRAKVQAAWFAYWLKDKGPLKQPEALTFQTGSNRWESYDEWPPRSRTTDRPLYFRGAGMASFDKPDGEGDFDSYVSDPAHPVPYRHRPISPTYPDGGWPTWLVEDQRFVHMRPDVLSWETEPLQQDLAVAGDIVTHLFASTSGTDTDWIVKLIDVYPEDYPKDPKIGGYQLMIADEVFRARFRESFTHPKAVVPDEVTEYAVDLHTNNHAFLKGHRIMVQVQSTWFPVIDRNPQTFVDNIYRANESDYKPATQRVYRSATFASHVSLPALTR
jgi:putative CocE/NonD family hydrolase